MQKYPVGHTASPQRKQDPSSHDPLARTGAARALGAARAAALGAGIGVDTGRGAGVEAAPPQQPWSAISDSETMLPGI